MYFNHLSNKKLVSSHVIFSLNKERWGIHKRSVNVMFPSTIEQFKVLKRYTDTDGQTITNVFSNSVLYFAIKLANDFETSLDNIRNYFSYLQKQEPSKPAITCSKLTIETLEQGVKYVQS